MYKTCPKCAYTRKAAEIASPGTCPSCGLVFEKYDAAMAQAQSLRQSARSVTRGDGGPGIGRTILGIAVTAVAAAAYYGVPALFTSTSAPPRAAVQLAGSGAIARGSRIEEFETLFNGGAPLRSLASNGEYTVVEVYLDTCGYCRQLEAALVPFMRKRADVGLVRVHHPGSLNIQIQGNSQEDMQRQADQMNARIKSYDICGTPHVEVYGPDRKLIAADSCGTKNGTSFVWDWIGQETGAKPGSGFGATRL